MSGRCILKAGRRTAFRYRIEGGMDERDRSEIESMDPVLCTEPDWHCSVLDSIDLRHHVAYMRRRHLGFRLLGCADESFRGELESVNPRLPGILGKMVADAYLDGTLRLDDLSENIEHSVPRGSAPRMWCHDAISSYLAHLGTDASPEDVKIAVVPVGFEGSFEINGDRRSGYETVLVFGLETIRIHRGITA